MPAVASQPQNMKSSTWFPPSACLSCFYLLQNLPVTQLFIHHLKYRAVWKHKLHIHISTCTAWKTSTKDCQEAGHVPLLSHFLLDMDINWQHTRFPFVYWFVYFLRQTHHQAFSPYPSDPTLGNMACWSMTFPKVLWPQYITTGLPHCSSWVCH